jgi:hypothetical protein
MTFRLESENVWKHIESTRAFDGGFGGKSRSVVTRQTWYVLTFFNFHVAITVEIIMPNDYSTLFSSSLGSHLLAS